MSVQEVTFPLVPRGRVVGLAYGSMQSARRGTGFDIAGARPYEPGDVFGSIDWRSSARLSSARDADEFIVRLRYAEQAPRVVVVADRRPAMALYPSDLPFLSKPAALRAVGELIADSAVAARGFVGYLDLANVAHPDPAERTALFWRPPYSQRGYWRVKERHLAHGSFFAPEDNLEQALEHLGQVRQTVPAGTFVFVLSDFLAGPGPEAWLSARENRWDVVPVVIQDPTWEASFPDVGRVTLPIADPATGRVRPVRLTRREARRLRAQNEERLERIVYEFRTLDLEPVVVTTADRSELLEAFLLWSAQRRTTVRQGW
jgi:uncharacterized protein (DUF58 family)